MAWQDRVREAAYEAPDGSRVTFDYEDVSRSILKKTSAFDFPDSDGTYIQDLGRSGRQYPLRIFFWGDDYDLSAAQFESLLLQKGVGRLEHPMYGVVKVVPFGEIRRRDELKTASNQSIIEVVFWESLDSPYQEDQRDVKSLVIQKVGQFNEVSAEALESDLSLETALERSQFKNTYENFLKAATTSLGRLSDLQGAAKNRFDTISRAINTGLDTLVGDPTTLALQTQQLIQAPARSAELIEGRLSAYTDLIDSLITGEGAVVEASFDTSSSNAFVTRDLFVSNYLIGAVLSATNGRFQTRPEALRSSESILDKMEQVNNWRDDNLFALGKIDPGAGYQKLQESVALSSSFLVSLSFSLKQEVSFVLDRNRTILELVYELYGSVDDELDSFIMSNNLTGSEILQLPKGRLCVYYT